MFRQLLSTYRWDAIQESIYAATAADVQRALQKPQRSLEDFKALISPAARPYLEQMAHLSHTATSSRFGKTVQLYIPLYLSNECQNICTYCGFSYNARLPRKTLSAMEILQEAAYLKQQGFEHVLLVTGEAQTTVGVDYLEKALGLLKNQFAQISIEVQPLDEEAYTRLRKAGLHAVLVYQETYHRQAYAAFHLKGKKANFDYRIDAPDRLGRAGVHKIGLGTLTGLEDWRTDHFFTALHLQYLEKTYWQTRYSISFPRLRPAESLVQPKVDMTDADLVQLICAWRLLNPVVELSLSTREKEAFRNHIFRLGITSMSAGSKTNPGGYVTDPASLEQFETDDTRSAAEIVQLIERSGYKAVWKDWEVFE